MFVARIVRSLEAWSNVTQVLFNPVNRVVTDGDGALLGAFSGDGEHRQFSVVFVESNRADFARTQAGGVHRFEDGAVANPQSSVICSRCFNEATHLSRRERSGNL